MQALVKAAPLPGHVSIEERPRPEPGSGEIRLRVKAAAVCGSDLQAYRYPAHYHFMQIPVILGHEVVGIVDEIGPDADTFQLGDCVVMESNRYCGVCRHCLHGRTTSCEKARIAGLHFDGGMAVYVVTSARLLHQLPDGLSFREATVAQPLSVVLHGLLDNNIRLPIGGPTVVFGPGIIGNLAAQALAALGASTVIVVGIDADEEVRLPLARKLGFVTANYRRDDLQALLAKHGAPHGVELVVECSGAPTTSATGIELLDKNGQLLLLGIAKEPELLPVRHIVRREIAVLGSYTSAWHNYEQALALIHDGSILLESLLVDYPLSEGVTAFKDTLDSQVMKPVLIP